MHHKGCGAVKAHIRTLLACPGTSIEPSYSYGLNGEPAQAQPSATCSTSQHGTAHGPGQAWLHRLLPATIYAARAQAHRHAARARNMSCKDTKTRSIAMCFMPRRTTVPEPRATTQQLVSAVSWCGKGDAFVLPGTTFCATGCAPVSLCLWDARALSNPDKRLRPGERLADCSSWFGLDRLAC